MAGRAHDILLQLGTQPDPDAGTLLRLRQLLDQATESEAPRLAARADRDRGYPTLYLNLRRLEQSLRQQNRPTPAALVPLMKAIEQRRPWILDMEGHQQQRLGQLRSVLKLLAGAGCRVMPVKGSALFLHYPDYVARHSNDIDLLLPGLAEMWRAVKVLEDAGHVVSSDDENPWLQTFDETGEPTLHGHVTLASPDRGRDIDIHSGNMSIGLRAMLASRIWERASVVRLDEVEVRLPTPEDIILFSLAHSCNHGFLLGKDLSDFHQIVGRERDLDWAYVLDVARRSGLGGGLRTLIDILREGRDTELVPRAVARDLRPDVCGRCLRWFRRRPGLWNLGQRIRAMCVLAGLHLVAPLPRGGRPAQVWLALRQFLRQIRLGILANPRLDWVQRPIQRLEYRPLLALCPPPPGRQILLAPLLPAEVEEFGDPQLAARWPTTLVHLEGEGMILARRGRDEVVLTAAGPFVPTANMMFYKRQLIAACSLAQFLQHHHGAALAAVAGRRAETGPQGPEPCGGRDGIKDGDRDA